MLMDRLQFTDPTADTSTADLTVTLVELFAHLGDLLHYRLDRVATEAWLSTARRRANVVRHARAVDFAVQPAISAATTVQVVVAAAAGSDPQVDGAARRHRHRRAPTVDPTGVLLHRSRRPGRRSSAAATPRWPCTTGPRTTRCSGPGRPAPSWSVPPAAAGVAVDGLAAGRLAARVRGGRR